MPAGGGGLDCPARQSHDELAALPQSVAVGLHVASVHLDQALGQRQTYAEAGLAVSVELRRLRKQIEHLRQHPGFNANAIVAYPYLYILADRSGSQFDATTGVGILDGVAQYIADNLRQARQVAIDKQWLRIHVDDQLMALVRHHRFHGLDRARDDGRQLNPLAMDSNLATSDARHIEQIVHQFRQMSELPLNDLACPNELHRRQLRIAHQLHGIVDRRQWIAQLVRQHRQELIFMAIGLAQCAIEPFELAGLFDLQGRIRLRKPGVGFSQAAIELPQLPSLAVQLDQHRDLAAQDFRYHRNSHVVDRPEFVTLQPVEFADMHTGDENDRRLFVARVLVNQRCSLEAVHSRHIHVEQHYP